jgi:hypothetical protein
MDCGADGAFARAVLAGLVARDVFVRMPFAPPQDRCIRVSCGTAADLAAFAAALPGALAAALRPWLETPAFRSAFAAKERHGETLAALPLLLADDPLLGLKGAATFACRLLAATTP